MSDNALQALSQEITRLGGLLRDMEIERDEAKAAQRQAERDEQEWRGIIETFGRVQHQHAFDTDEDVVHYAVSSMVLRAAGRERAVMLFVDGLRKVLEGRVTSLPLLARSAAPPTGHRRER